MAGKRTSAPLQRYSDWARTSIWLVPIVLCAAAVILGPLMLFLDRTCAACARMTSRACPSPSRSSWPSSARLPARAFLCKIPLAPALPPAPGPAT